MPDETTCPADYDDFVDWSARLAREGPFFREAFKAAGVRRVLDVGAGSARHAIMFATWGLDVVAVDPDESMLLQAEGNVAQAAEEISASAGSVRLAKLGFGELAAAGIGAFDAITCTGNALPHVSGREGLRDALTDFAAMVRRGGILVIHMLNHSRLLTQRPRTIPPKVRDLDGTTKVFVRLIGYPDPTRLDFDFLTLTRDPDGSWSLQNRRSTHAAIPVELLVKEVARAGFDNVRVYGGHARSPLDPDSDESLVLIADRL